MRLYETATDEQFANFKLDSPNKDDRLKEWKVNENGVTWEQVKMISGARHDDCLR